MTRAAVCIFSNRLYAVKQRHKPKIHVQLLMTMEQRHSRIVRHEIEGDLLIPAQHDNVLHHPCSGLAHDVGKLKDVPVQVDGMKIFALIMHSHAVTPTFM